MIVIKKTKSLALKWGKLSMIYKGKTWYRRGGGGGGGGWSKKDKAKNTMTLLTFLKESIINHLDQMSLFQGRVPVLDSC